MNFSSFDYISTKEKSIKGRYISREHIYPLLRNLSTTLRVNEIGRSVEGATIESIDFGSGKHKILMWSQMHGNESTTTKALFDLLNFIVSGSKLAEDILTNCTIKIIPMLNPDGSAAYTRVNANAIDLNRDAQELSQPESRVLREIYNVFQPDFCFNLHDQRTMYNVGDSDKPATVSFLAPAMDEQRSISKTRGESMRLIAAMNKQLQELIPNQVGRYDDSFNANCVGDTFQMLGTPTILFEAGHYPADYEREKTREYLFISLLTALETIAKDKLDNFPQDDYFKIPENGKRFFDILVKNAHLLDSDFDMGVVLGILYVEELVNGAIHFKPKLESVFGDGHFFGHQTLDCAKPDDLARLKAQPFLLRSFTFN